MNPSDCYVDPKEIMTYCYIFCTCGENVGKIQAKEKAKHWIIKYLAFFLVPRPAFEILNINRREQILFTTKSHVFTYIWTIYKQHWIELNLMRLKLFQDNWEQFGNNSLTLQCSIQKLNWRLWKWLHLYGRLPKRTM